MTTPTEFWAGEGGNAYLQRNRVDWRARIPFWKEVLDRTGARSVMELGANEGWNLLAYQAAAEPKHVMLTGWDVNLNAAQSACKRGAAVYYAHPCEFSAVAQALAHHGPAAFPLTFTAGCLIHIPPAEIENTMRSLIDLSSRYVLAVEYAADPDFTMSPHQEIEYQGAMGLLWKRDYGKLYEALGLKRVDEWDAPHPAFDHCRAWLLEKT